MDMVNNINPSFFQVHMNIWHKHIGINDLLHNIPSARRDFNFKAGTPATPDISFLQNSGKENRVQIN